MSLTLPGFGDDGDNDDEKISENEVQRRLMIGILSPISLHDSWSQ